MYERYYGLKERPFDLSANIRFLFLSAQHHEALTHLRYGLSGRPGMTLLTGEAGMGKSTLIRAALQSELPHASKTVLLSNPTLTRAEFYEFLAREFAFSDEAIRSKTHFLEELKTAIDACRQAGGVLALIVDEAQSMPFELLEELRLLTNTEGASERTVALLLVGQPELAERMEVPALRQLKQRVALRCELQPFSLKETAGYIAARITAAGGHAGTMFTRDAVVAIHQAARGLPRTINVLCDNALVTAFADEVKPVGRDIIALVCADFHLSLSPAAAQNGSLTPGTARNEAAPQRPQPWRSPAGAAEPAVTRSAAPAANPAPPPSVEDQPKPRRGFLRRRHR